MKTGLKFTYEKLYASFGPQRWWPADTAFEVMVGAILTQNTSWLNVEKAIANLRKNNLLEPLRLYRLPHGKLASYIKPTGYFNIKARRLKEFLKFFIKSYKGNIEEMSLMEAPFLRQQLLCVNGIGPETADSILLYALKKPVFVVDAYTKRILVRHSFVKDDATYSAIQDLFTENLVSDAKLFNEFHALLVRLGKDFCLKSKPKCDTCPLNHVK